MNRAAMRIVTGLPRFTRVDELERIAQMNTIQEIAEEQGISQALRLSRTPQGRTILTLSGRAHLTEGPFMPTPPPPWETEAVTVAKPIPKNQGNDSPGRRVTQASNHMAEVRGLGGHIEVFYTDASRSETGRMAIAWYSPTKQDTQQEITENTKSTCSAELRAILMATQAAILKRANITETRIYTDSQDALRELRRTDTCNAVVAQIRTLVRKVKDDQTITVAWLPGHEGIPGNERANGAARAELQATQPSQGPVPPLSPRKVPEDTADFDLSEVKREERAARKARLTTLLPPNGPTLTAFRAAFRDGSGWPSTDSKRRRIYHRTDPDDVGPDPNCEHCGVPATCSHLVWDCAESAPEREAAIRNLPYHIRPCSYTEWTKPTTAILNEQKLIYTSLIDFLRSSGIATDFRDALGDVVDSQDIIGIGQFQMSHVWMVTCANALAKAKLVTKAELRIKGRRCLIIDPDTRDLRQARSPAEEVVLEHLMDISEVVDATGEVIPSSTTSGVQLAAPLHPPPDVSPELATITAEYDKSQPFESSPRRERSTASSGTSVKRPAPTSEESSQSSTKTVAGGHNSDERGDAKRRPAEVCEHPYSKATRPADVVEDADELPP
ncbi:hypothetical protein HPB47_019819 [Ixodes persulcatus]|uniref:Uncharacterized protein n=1 Tax=Ixodes persulcatus TaxID=34615 RepID=A0AC60QJ35_IXOPE|nr:hypothetical protein HPB47_019819 [Ixodes persulcatus]